MTETEPRVPAQASSSEPAQSHDVFVSYARADREIVVELVASLDARGLRTWVDLEDIPPSAEWMGEIRAAIEAADGYLVVVSPALASSKVCAEELELAREAGKRIVPVMVRPTDPGSVPGALAALNWIDAVDGEFDSATDRAVEALRTDLDHVRAHTKLGVRATEWERKDDTKALLLRGGEIAEAEAVVASGSEPRATPLQARFVQGSRAAATRRQRGFVTAVAAALAVSLALSAFALVQRNQAIRERNVALSRELAASSIQQLDVDPELSLLLGIEAATTQTPEAADALRRALVASHVVATMRGHQNPVTEATFSPDGTRILTSTSWTAGLVGRLDADDYTARIWDAATGRQLQTLSGHTASILSSQFSPDGSRILTSSQDGMIRIWDSETGQALHSLSGLGGPRGDASFSPDGSSVLSANKDGVGIWDVETGKRVQILEKVGGQIKEAVYVPNSELVVGRWGFHSGLALWDADSGRSVSILKTPFPPLLMAVSADGRRILAEGDQAVRVWDVRGLEEVATWRTGKISFVFQTTGGTREGYDNPVRPAFSADGSRVITMNDVASATIWDADTGKQVAVLDGSTPADVEFSPDGSRVLSINEDHTARIWDPDTGDELARLLGHTDALWSGHFSPDGERVLTASLDLSAKVWLVDPGASTAAFGEGPVGDGSDVVFGPDNSTLVTGGAGAAKIWNIGQSSAAVLKAPALGRYVNGVASSPDGSLVAAATSHRTVQLWDTVTTEPTITIRFPKGEGPGGDDFSQASNHEVWTVAFSPDGSLLSSSSQDGLGRLWDPVTGDLVATLAGHEGGVNEMAFSPDGGRVVTVSDDGSGRIWRVATAETLLTLDGHAQGIAGVSWSPDGRVIATVGYDSTARIWDARTGKQLHLLSGFQGTGISADFSPDSRWLATVSYEDATLRIWEVSSGRLVASRRGDLLTMSGVDFSPDGSLIAVSGGTVAGGATLLFPCETCEPIRELLALAEERVTRVLTMDERRQFLHET